MAAHKEVTGIPVKGKHLLLMCSPRGVLGGRPGKCNDVDISEQVNGIVSVESTEINLG